MDGVSNIYRGGGVPKLSRAQIQAMKKNMKKAPIIKEKAENYHKHEELEADKLLEKIIEESSKQK